MREFHNTARTGKTRVWKISVDGDQVITEYGDLNGTMQRVADTALEKNVGRSNYVSPEVAAIQQMDRQILKQTRSGYTEVGGEKEEKITSFGEMDFTELPGNLRYYKPQNTLSKTLEKKLEDGNNGALLARKRDGEMMPILMPDGGYPQFYSRNMLKRHHLEPHSDWVNRFIHIADELYYHDDIPDKTILLGEIVAHRSDRRRWDTASIMKTKSAESIKFQDEHGKAYFYCWDIAVWGGEDWVSTKTVRERYDLIRDLFEETKYILPVEYYTTDDIEATFDDAYDSALEDEKEEWDAAETIVAKAMFLAKIWDWEGFVVVDPDGVYGDKAYNFRGKTDRPGKFCCKLKPVYELDAILLWDPDNSIGFGAYGKYGRGKYQGLVGSVELYQYDAKGNLVYLCDCGGGINDEFRKKYSDPESYPIVAEIQFNDRSFKSKGDKSNALQFPRIVRIRHDKKVEECIEEEF